ncbi:MULTISPECIES: hypothetical protein [Brevibacterium]|uniref:Uncharacterized protein n=1 Tax=Brevibacterium antiquum CNRZ 918 TaxID=1255637 RepID=A0A2H1KEK8_9MICO|nr:MULTISPECIES: hypothetical protein [Brevibacterium]SMX98193.1 hypothetical protein BANT918_02400 [Brevibacterium antiquum CNRZ 918]HCG55322.1 hypothetical protein [Brevibacterium sp.]
MALDPVPTWIHGAKHSGDILRQGTFNQTGGAEGVSSPTAFRVRATQTPSNKVRVDPGGLLMLSPWDEGQTYSMRNASETLVEVPASSSLSANTWYINAWVNDPKKPGGTEPVSVPYGPYNFLTCDPEPKDNNPAYACAKIVVPKSTAIVEQDMITDLRELAQPHRQQLMFGRPRITEDESRNLGLTVAAGGEYFPGGNGAPNTFKVFVPTWATHILVDASWMSVRYAGSSNPYGQYWIEYGDEYKDRTWPGNRQYEFATQTFAFNSPGTSNNVMRMDWRLMSSQHIDPKLRGKTITMAFKAGRQDSGPSADVSMDALSGLGMQLAFVQTTLDPKSNEDPA